MLRDLAAQRCVCPWERVDAAGSFLRVAGGVGAGDGAGAAHVLPRCGGRCCAAVRCAHRTLVRIRAAQTGSSSYNDLINYSSITLLGVVA